MIDCLPFRPKLILTKSGSYPAVKTNFVKINFRGGVGAKMCAK
jgi:hypothetical protein